MFARFRRTPRTPEPAPRDGLDRVMLRLGPDGDDLTFRMAGHISVLGSSGSGKGQAVCPALALAFLTCGYGGLVLAAKDERERWRALCRYAGRGEDFTVVDRGASAGYNFLEDCVRTAPTGASMVAAEILDAAGEAASHARGGSSGHADPFWGLSKNRLVRSAIDLLLLADEPLSVESILRVIISTPTYPDDRFDSVWTESSYCAFCCRKAAERATPDTHADLRRAYDHLLIEIGTLSDKTRSSIVAVFTSAADLLNRTPLREMFGGRTTVRPADALAGRVLYIDLPTLHHGVVGQMAMAIWKRAFQRAVGQRLGPEGAPVFLFMDEAQEHTTRDDVGFLAIARESRCTTVLVSQTSSGYEARLGKEGAEGLLSACQTHVFLSNAGPTTEWASKLIAQTWRTRASYSRGERTGQQPGTQNSLNAQFSKSLDAQVLPHEFTTLRTASPQNRGIADAIVFCTGRVWSNGQNFLRTSFRRVELPDH